MTDGDAELVLSAKGGDDGFERLTVIDPNGRRIVGFRGNDGGDLGMREFLLESPEPGVDPVLDAFPEGEYVLVGRTFDGTVYAVSPADGEVVRVDRPLVLSWDPVAGAASYTVEVENDRLEVGLLVTVPTEVLAVTVSPELLLPGVEYEFGVGTEVGNGNRTFVEVAFTTVE